MSLSLCSAMETTEGNEEVDSCSLRIGISSSPFAWNFRLRSHTGFDGQFKCRFEDFHVHEIDIEGQIQHLTELYQKEELTAELSLINQRSTGAALNNYAPNLFSAEEEAIRVDGSLSEDDVETLHEFLLKLSAKRAEAQSLSHVSDNTNSQEQQSDSKCVSIDEVEMSFFCVLMGNFLREWRKCSQLFKDNIAITEQKVCSLWKNIRTGVHATIQKHFPFLMTEAVPWEIVKKMIPAKCPTSDENTDKKITETYSSMLRLKDYIEKIREEVGEETAFVIFKSLLVVRVFPKPQCLASLLFNGKQVRYTKNNFRRNYPNIAQRNELSDGFTYPAEIQHISVCLWKSPPNIERWPKNRGNWLHFRIYKENRDTAEVINMLSRCLNRRVKDFSYAGTKDKRAITVQAACVHKVTLEQMKRAMLHPLWDNKVKISTFCFKSERLQLGHLQGNHFRVALRGVPLESSFFVDMAFNEFKERGFVNYFGAQRFGTFEIKTYEIGAALLSKNWKAAVRLILGDTNQRFCFSTSNGCGSPTSAVPSGKIIQRDVFPSQSVFTQSCAIFSPTSKTSGSDAEDFSSLQENTTTAPNAENLQSENLSKSLFPNTESSDFPCAISTFFPLEDSLVSQKPCSVQPAAANHEKREEAESQFDITSVSLQARRAQACAFYLEKGDANEALKLLPRYYHLERAVLKSLQAGFSFKQCLKSLPLNSLTLYLHAVQSLVFNFVASYRIQKFGLRPVIGDFVMQSFSNSPSSMEQDLLFAEAVNANVVNESEDAGQETNINDSYGRAKRFRFCSQENSTESVMKNIRNSLENGCGVQLENTWNNSRVNPIRVLTSEKDCQNCSLFDVVLPIPGDRITYPEHLKQVYEEAMHKFFRSSLSKLTSPFPETSRVGSLTGNYRFLIVKPRDVSWSCTANPSLSTERLLSSDLDNLLGNALPEKKEQIFSFTFPKMDNNCPDGKSMSLKSIPTSPVKSTLLTPKPMLSSSKNEEVPPETMAVLFSCSLPKSAYLSMALRELLSEKSFNFI